MHVSGLIGELLLELSAAVGFGAQRRATDGRTNQRKMDTRFREVRADELVPDLVQADLATIRSRECLVR